MIASNKSDKDRNITVSQFIEFTIIDYHMFNLCFGYRNMGTPAIQVQPDTD